MLFLWSLWATRWVDIHPPPLGPSPQSSDSHHDPATTDDQIWRYSVFHLFQNSSAVTCTHFPEDLKASLVPNEGNNWVFVFIVRGIDGISSIDASGSLETSINGLLLTKAHTSAIKMTCTSCVMSFSLWFSIIAFKIFCKTPMSLFHAPPMWGACGG